MGPFFSVDATDQYRQYRGVSLEDRLVRVLHPGPALFTLDFVLSCLGVDPHFENIHIHQTGRPERPNRT